MSPTDDVVTLVHGRNEHGVEVDRPDPVVGFLEPDALIDEGVGEVDANALPAEPPREPAHDPPLAKAVMTDRVTPTLPSRDLAATSAFYARLDFREVFRDAGWLIVARGPLQLEFFPHPALDPGANYGGCCLRVGDARALHDAFSAAGLPVDPGGIPRLTPPQAQSWGFREFALVDLDGNLLRGLEPLQA